MILDNNNIRQPILADQEVPEDLAIVVCIPCYNEPYIIDSIQSLTSTEYSNFSVEVMVLINERETEDDAVTKVNQKAYDDILGLSMNLNISGFALYPIYVQNISSKIAGVGYARKFAMDEAYRRLTKSGSATKVIACFDADCTCEPNYLNQLHVYFSENSKIDAVSIAFAHPLQGVNKNEIINYELHLRYFIEMQRWIKLPYAFQTVGSSMAVRAESYISEGGMNRRKAGEDFYFLHKYISKYKCGELNCTTITPSSRVSERVPFGTGRAVLNIKSDKNPYTTYQYESFTILSQLLYMLHDLYMAEKSDVRHIIETLENDVLIAFLTKINAVLRILEIKDNTTSYKSFYKRFYQWFNAFQLMKYLHYMRDNGYPNIELRKALDWLFDSRGLQKGEALMVSLITLRDIQRESNYAELVQGWP